MESQSCSIGKLYFFQKGIHDGQNMFSLRFDDKLHKRISKMGKFIDWKIIMR